MDHPAAIIFDFDGLIADTESAIYLAWRELYQSHGHDLPLSTYVRCVGSTFHTYNPMQELENLLGYEPDELAATFGPARLSWWPWGLPSIDLNLIVSFIFERDESLS